MQPVARDGIFLVISSPSGAGKTTLSRRLLAADPAIELSVSVTTRSMRRGEEDGRDYHFKSVAEFEALVRDGAFLEHARVHDNLYGTLKSAVAHAEASGKDLLLDIDWQGAQQIHALAPRSLVSVYVLPPAARTLAARLEARNQDAPDVVKRRLAAAAAELSHWREYDYVIINDDLEASVAGLIAILKAERQRRARLTGLDAFVAGMIGDLS